MPYVVFVPYRSNGISDCDCEMEPSNLSGSRVVISMTAPIELPGYAAENGPYIMSTRSISSGATSPQRGPPIVLLLAMSADSGTPSAKTRLRALDATPHTRVPITACVSPLLRFRMNTLGRYFTASGVSMRLIVSSTRLAVTLALTGIVRRVSAGRVSRSAVTRRPPRVVTVSRPVESLPTGLGGWVCARAVPATRRALSRVTSFIIGIRRRARALSPRSDHHRDTPRAIAVREPSGTMREGDPRGRTPGDQSRSVEFGRDERVRRGRVRPYARTDVGGPFANGSACAGRSGMRERTTAAATLAWRARCSAIVMSTCGSTAAVMVEHWPRQVQHGCPSCAGASDSAAGADEAGAACSWCAASCAGAVVTDVAVTAAIPECMAQAKNPAGSMSAVENQTAQRLIRTRYQMGRRILFQQYLRPAGCGRPV